MATEQEALDDILTDPRFGELVKKVAELRKIWLSMDIPLDAKLCGVTLDTDYWYDKGRKEITDAIKKIVK